MTLVTLTDPANGTLADATLIANNNTELENAINGNLDSGNLANNSVGTSELQDLSVTTPKIADGAVTNAKLAGGITADKLASGIVLPGSITVGAAPPASPTVGQYWYYPLVTGGAWSFTYQPSIDALYPWIYVGGSPLIIGAGSGYSGASSGGERLVWVHNDGFCGAPSLPKAGSYNFTWTASISSLLGSGTSVFVTGVSIQGNDPVEGTGPGWWAHSFTAPAGSQLMAGQYARQVVTDHWTVRLVYWTDYTFTVNLTQMWVIPQRVAA